MNVKLTWCFLAVLCCSTWSFAQEEAPPPPPADDAPPARADDRPPPPADEGSPSDQRPDLNDRTSRSYAPGKQAPMQQGPYQAPGKQAPMQGPEQAPGKQAPMAQGPHQAPGKQAPMQQGPMRAPGKGAAYYGGQPYTAGYANYNCAGCGDGGYQQNYYSGGYNTGNRYARRGVFGRRWR